MLVKNINFTSNTQNKSVVSEPVQRVIANDSKKGDSFVSQNKTKIGIGVVSLGLLTVLGVIIKRKLNIAKPNIIKEASAELLANPINYIMEVPEEKLVPEFRDMFTKLNELKGKDFIGTAYESMVKKLGYEGCAPKLEIKPLDANNACFRGVEGIITVNENKLANKTNEENLAMLFHEFTHFIQTSDIVRTKNLGADKYLQWIPKSDIYQASLDKELCRVKFKKPYDELSKDEIDNYTSEYMNDLKQEFNYSFYQKIIEKKGTIDPNTALARQANKYLDALYETLNPSVSVDLDKEGYRMLVHPKEFYLKLHDDYAKNHFEATAFNIEAKIKKLFNLFTEQIISN